MRNNAKIRGVKVGVDMNGYEFLEGFYIEGKGGAIDPFVDDNFSLDIHDKSQCELLEWGRSMIGKTLFYGELQPYAWFTTSKVYIL